MPSDIKAALSVAALLVAFAYAYWEWVAGSSTLAWVAALTGIFAVASMWVFPEAVKEQKGRSENAAKVGK
jgi:hypothetical protein